MGAPPAANAIVASAAAGSGSAGGSGSGTVVSPSPEAAGALAAAGDLAPGTLVGPRFAIVKLLGKGGMGAVYLAHDLELKREVALKLIAPHLATEPETIERFRREIHLSSIVTHPNVLRVFDLGESDGVRFLTMQYIEGRSLADLLAQERRLPVDRAVALFRQICEGLAAAHDQGVLHRDLKPQNVMVDAEGRAYLTDFGLATSESLPTMTRTGALMGTPQYMSPEQVKGQPVDVRSDIFSLGVVFYEMLSGAQPYTGDTIFEVMIRRTQAPPRPLREANVEVPPALQKLVDRCLAIEPELRYGSVGELLGDLDAGTVRVRVLRRVFRPRLWPRRLRTGVALGLVLLVGAAAALLGKRLQPRRAGPPTARTVLVADFDNRTGESVFNDTLEPALSTALEGASFITTYNRGTAHRIADQLQLDGQGLTERRARLVAQREGVGIVTAGTIDREGSGYRVGVRAVDAFTGQRIVEQTEEVPGKDAALVGVTKLAARVRTALGDATPVGVQLQEGETFSARSLEAAHEYGIANDLALAQGRYDEARQHYLEAIRLDPELGRAYSGIAVLERNRGRRADVEKYLKDALAHVDRMSERERLRTRGLWFMLRRDDDKTIETYQELVRQYPSDNAGLANLGIAYGYKGDFGRALEYTRRAVTLSPGNVPQRNNLGMFAMYVGSFDDAMKEQARVVELNPSFPTAYFGLALAQLASGRRDDAIATWPKLEALGPSGASAAAEGLADLAIYEGRLSEARKLLDRGLKSDVAQNDREGAGRKRAIMGEVLLSSGDVARAVSAAEQASRSTQDTIVIFTAANVLAEAGKDRRALSLADELEQRLEPQPRMYAEIVRGGVERRRKDYRASLEHLKVARQHLDSWLVRFALARTYVEAGAYAEAQDELDRCEKRRGESTDVFQENLPTFRIYPPVRYWLGRTYEGLGSPAAASAYRSFLALKRSDEEPMARDARRRLASLDPKPTPAR